MNNNAVHTSSTNMWEVIWDVQLSTCVGALLNFFIRKDSKSSLQSMDTTGVEFAFASAGKKPAGPPFAKYYDS